MVFAKITPVPAPKSELLLESMPHPLASCINIYRPGLEAAP